MSLHRPVFFPLILSTAFAIGCGDDPDASGEPTAFRVRVENVAAFDHLKSGTFAVPVGADGPGPLAPGDAYEVTFTAGPNHRLSFATMFGQSNDWFFAPVDGSVALYDEGGEPVSGDITALIGLYDAGTEIDEEPAVGPHTGPNQSMSADGPGDPDPDDAVRLVANPAILTGGGEFDRPSVDEMIAVTLTGDADAREFTLRIENVSEDNATLMTSEGASVVRVSPGVWSVGDATDLLFAPGSPDRGEGLEEIAESGDISVLSASLEPRAGVATPISPGLAVIHGSGQPLFADGEADRGLGLELIAERGDPSELAASFDASLPEGASSFIVFNTPAGAGEPGPIRPGDAYEIDIEAVPGDRLALATMFGASNDWIFATAPEGVALFDAAGAPIDGDVTAEVAIWNLGTELDEEPAVGPNIGGPEGPADSDDAIRPLTPGEYPAAAGEHVLVTISPR